MTSADVSVRAAHEGDAAAVAEVQVDAWRTCYAPRLPPGALDALDATLVEARWRAAVTAPPSAMHRLLVALSAGRLCGYVAIGPAEDGDATAEDGEMYALTVEPAEQRLGHGSRLLAAGVEALTQLGFRVARMWTFDGDDPLHAFLTGAGWAADGATRSLDMGEVVGQQRWHTLLPEA
jgi:ribosomal protein S18 acetylase RimI-like enzyme